MNSIPFHTWAFTQNKRNKQDTDFCTYYNYSVILIIYKIIYDIYKIYLLYPKVLCYLQLFYKYSS